MSSKKLNEDLFNERYRMAGVRCRNAFVVASVIGIGGLDVFLWAVTACVASLTIDGIFMFIELQREQA